MKIIAIALLLQILTPLLAYSAEPIKADFITNTTISKEDLNNDDNRIILTLKKQLKKKGIYVGKIYYSKYKQDNLAVLSKVHLREIQVNALGYFTATFSDGENEVTEHFTDTKDLETCLKEKYFISLPKWGNKVLTAIRNNKVLIGMTKEQIVASWGNPEDINRTVGRWVTHEQWVYGEGGPYLYIENGKLASFQD